MQGDIVPTFYFFKQDKHIRTKTYRLNQDRNMNRKVLSPLQLDPFSIMWAEAFELVKCVGYKAIIIMRERDRPDRSC